MLSALEASNKSICQMCEKSTIGGVVYDDGKHFMHSACFLKVNKKTNSSLKEININQFCQICKEPCNESIIYEGERYYIHTNCYNKNKQSKPMLSVSQAIKNDICQICEKQAVGMMKYVPNELYVHESCLEKKEPKQMLTVQEAYKKDICQVCEKPANDTMVYHGGAYYMHTDCYNKVNQEENNKSKHTCRICKEPCDESIIYEGERYYVHTDCYNKPKRILSVEEARAAVICQICHSPDNGDMTYENKNYYMHTKCYNEFIKENKAEHAQFESGAIRSSDTKDVDFWLITPIGLEAVAKAYEQSDWIIQTKADLINLAKDSLNNYVKGKRNLPYLALATINLFDLIHYDKYNEIYGRPNTSLDIPNYSAIPPFALRELARTYNEGKIKYSEYNCELGFPVHDLINHALNHVNLYELGDTTERHLSHASWNTIMAIHSLEVTPEVSVGFLRGEGCTLTPEIRKRIDDAKRKKS